MVEAAANFLFALETAVKNYITFKLQIGNLDRQRGAARPLKIEAIPLRAINSVSSY